MTIINADSSAIESVGCEKGFFTVENNNGPKIYIGSYTDIIFPDYFANQDPKNILKLGPAIMIAMEGIDKLWGLCQVGLERLKGLHGCKNSFCLKLNLINYGNSKGEARKLWGLSLSKLGEKLENLPENLLKE